MKRASWITWRIFLITLPIDVVVKILSADHRLKSWNDVFIWGAVGLISHISLVPLIAIGVVQSKHWKNWKFDFTFLLLLGALRGVVINICVNWFELTMNVSALYKVLNSALALPLWFICVAVFIESHRDYQNIFRELFARAMCKEQETHERRDIFPSGLSPADESIARLQFYASNLSSEIQQLLNRPKKLHDFTIQAERIQNLIVENIRPVSNELWHENRVKTPKISFRTLMRIVLFESRLSVFPIVFIVIPYLYIGLYGALGFKIALFQCALVTIFNLTVFKLAELIYHFKYITRAGANLMVLVLTFILPYAIQLTSIPNSLSVSSDKLVVFFYQLFLGISYLVLLIILNGYTVIQKHREEVVASLENHISSDKYNLSVSLAGETQHNTDIANYLHGEIQAGLTASSLLLQQAAKSGDSDLAQEALKRASSLLQQDFTNISYTRMATPDIRIKKIIDAWKGIANISISLPSFDKLEEGVLRSSVQLIEEAVANSIRHAAATDIKVSGVLENDLLALTVVSNGRPMVKGKAGLGTEMFNDLATEWSYTTESGHNQLTFTLTNSI